MDNLCSWTCGKAGGGIALSSARVAPGSSPKHTIYAIIIIYSQIGAIFAMWKERNKQIEAGFGPFKK